MALTFGRKKSKNKKVKSKWTYWQFVFWGFSFIVGFAYLIGLNKSFSLTGNLMIVTICIGSLVAYLSGVSFAKISVKFHTNGGAYLYCRHAFGKKIAWYVGFFQYIQAPIVAVGGLFGILWAFTSLHIGTPGGRDATSVLSKNWYLFLVDFSVFFFIQIVLFFGFTSSKWVLWILLFISDVFIVISFILSIVVMAKYATNNVIHNIFQNGFRPAGGYSYSGFISAIFTFFFAYGGFEGVAIVSDDVVDAEKNFGKALLTIIVFVGVFYMFWYYIYLGAVGSTNQDTLAGRASNRFANGDSIGMGDNSTDYNPFVVLFRLIGVRPVIFATVGFTIVWIVWVFAQVSNKGSARLMNGWVNARILATLSADSLLPHSLSKQSKYKQYHWALLFDGVVTFVFVMAFYLVFRLTAFKLADILDIYTVTAFMQYIGVGLAALWLTKKKVINNISRIWQFLIALNVLILFFLLFSYIVSGLVAGVEAIRTGINASNSDSIGTIVTTLVALLLFLTAIGFYYLGRILKWHKIDEHTLDPDELDKLTPHKDLSAVQDRQN